MRGVTIAVYWDFEHGADVENEDSVHVFGGNDSRRRAVEFAKSKLGKTKPQTAPDAIYSADESCGYLFIDKGIL